MLYCWCLCSILSLLHLVEILFVANKKKTEWFRSFWVGAFFLIFLYNVCGLKQTCDLFRIVKNFASGGKSFRLVPWIRVLNFSQELNVKSHHIGLLTHSCKSCIINTFFYVLLFIIVFNHPIWCCGLPRILSNFPMCSLKMIAAGYMRH